MAAPAKQKQLEFRQDYASRDPAVLMPSETVHALSDMTSSANGQKWRTLEHNGVLFQPPYVPLPEHVKMTYEGRAVALSLAAEEAAVLYARLLETDYVRYKNFNRNFWRSWSDLLGKTHDIKGLEGCDFGPIHRHLSHKREEKHTASVKQQRRAQQAQESSIYGFALVDGERVKVGGYRVDPVGIFRGRGHRMAGAIKARVQPEDVTLNIGAHTPIPRAPAGHQWKAVVHNPHVSWLACWRSNVTQDNHYVFLILRRTRAHASNTAVRSRTTPRSRTASASGAHPAASDAPADEDDEDTPVAMDVDGAANDRRDHAHERKSLTVQRRRALPSSSSTSSSSSSISSSISSSPLSFSLSSPMASAFPAASISTSLLASTSSPISVPIPVSVSVASAAVSASATFPALPASAESSGLART